LATTRSRLVWARRARLPASGVTAFGPTAWLASKIDPEAGDRPAFPPDVVVAIKALACELPSRRGLPLAHWSVADLRREAVASGIVAEISGTTLWRWLGQDALRPWRHRSWLFPRDPQFARKAGRVIDLYQRRWKGAALGPRDHVLCIDEKTSIQARRRKHPSLPPAPGRVIYVEHEYVRTGALAYLAAWDVHRARLFGRCERNNSIAALHRLVGQIMRQEPYRSARRVFLITDNGSCHRGRRAADRLHAKWANIVLVHTPVHASWLNQLEVYFSIVQRKLLTPSSFSSLADLRRKLMAFQDRYQRSAKPFNWTFTRRDLHALLAKLKRRRYRARKLRRRNTSP
jgi:DDE superfamily endonuclease